MYVSNNRLNPNPITKFVVVGFLGFTVIHSINPYFEWAVIFLISSMFLINGYKKDALKSILIFSFLFFAPNYEFLYKLPFFIKMILSLFFVMRMFYIPFLAGKFLIKTSDVGSIISSMDYLHIPSCFSIPIAVMFRFFPSFKEERNHIKQAMKIRGIQTKNPFKYLEYVAIPLLIISSNIAEDISKSIQTKCIENPVKKTRYTKIGLSTIDILYSVSIIGLVIGGWYVKF